jgi:polyisoprenoid-binding protein YceI
LATYRVSGDHIKGYEMLTLQPMHKITAFIATSGVCLMLAACGPTATTSAPTSAPVSAAAPTTLPASAAPAATLATSTGNIPTAAARPTQSNASTPAASEAAPQIPAAAASVATSAAAADAVRLVIDSSASQASYHAREQLVGKSLPTPAVGTSKSVSGNLTLGPDGTVLSDQSKISVDLTKLQSDESRRDNWIKNDTLQTSRFPMATFVPSGVQGLPMPLPTSGQATFQLLGDLTVHGVTKPVTWQVTAEFADATISGTATTSVNITDFGMTLPKVGPVLSVEDALTLELAFTAARG